MINFIRKIFNKTKKANTSKRPIDIYPEAAAYLTNPRND